MIEQRYAVYCFSIEKTLFAPLRYPAGGGKPFLEVLALGAWIQQVVADNNGTMPSNFSDRPKDFKPHFLSYATLKPIDASLSMEHLADNVFVVLMPSFPVPADLQLLELVLDARYREHLKQNNISVRREERSEDILQLKPSFMGIGVNLRALWKRLFGDKRAIRGRLL